MTRVKKKKSCGKIRWVLVMGGRTLGVGDVGEYAGCWVIRGNTLGVGDGPGLVLGHVEVDAHEHALARDIHVGDALLVEVLRISVRGQRQRSASEAWSASEAS